MADPVAPAPAAPKPSVLSVVFGFLLSGTGRRLLVFLLGFLTVALNKRFGLDLDANQLVGELALILGYITQSAVKEASDAHAEAKLSAASVSTPAAAVAELNKS